MIKLDAESTIKVGRILWAGIAALLILLAIAGPAAADYYANKNLILNIDQSVEGSGYFMNYKSIRMSNAMGLPGENANGVEAKNYAHGSGSLDSASLLSAESSNRTEAAAEDSAEVDYEEAISTIKMAEESKMSYQQTIMGIGSGFYAINPIGFASLLNERTWIKSRGGASFMENQIDRAQALDKQLELEVRDFVSEEDPSITTMDISQSLINGRAHIGVVQGDVDAMEETVIGPDSEETETLAFAKSAWKRPQIYLDEDYFGTMQIDKKMNLTSILDESEEDDYWLPCCSGDNLT